jgi:trimethylamine-N-oxide reductase (cytochrome c)
MKRLVFSSILRALPVVIRRAARKHKVVRDKLAQRNLVVQIQLKDASIIRHFAFRDGAVKGHSGSHAKPDAVMSFKDVDVALDFLKPNPDLLVVIDALKNFKVTAVGRDEDLTWFGSLMNIISTASWEYGVGMPDGSMRYTNLTNGGPIFVFVKDGKVIRTTPIDFDDTDPQPWSLNARGKTFTPKRQATINCHALAFKSLLYSDRRVLYPMKRVDYDPNGERNTQNRGISGYERISWDQALEIVANEIQRQKRVHGPGSILVTNPAHHQWGNLNYWLSSLQRFMNIIGASRVGFTAISWEGWYQGAMHHFANNFRLGMPGFTGTTEDCLNEAEMVVFWSSDPESTGQVYAGQEGTQHRMWARELGIEFVHIDPHLNATAQMYGGKWFPIKPGTDAAMAQAIMYQWIVDDTYDQQYVAQNTTGFEAWRDYLLGKSDGVPKTPEWQEKETGIPAKDVRTLARVWARRKTYLAAGSLGAGLGGACRADTGSMWTRCMVQMMAMRGWGKPGINFGNLSFAARMDLSFYFPGYSEGGISGDLVNNASAVNNYQRMPHIITMNSCQQTVPRQRIAEAILGTGKVQGRPMDPTSLQAQMQPYEYPKAGYSRIHMLYRYGTSNMGVILQSGRMLEAFRDPSLEFTVSQCIHMEGDAQFSDIILPACTSLERFDIAESAGAGGVLPLGHYQLNHRVFVMQHKAIEPLGESKPDYQIFADILERIGGAGMYTEGGNTDLTWCKRIFDSSDLPKRISWKKFMKKGYFVLPAISKENDYPTEMRWFAEGRAKDTPEMTTLPSQHTGTIGQGLGTPSSKFEFVPQSLAMIEGTDPARPAVNRYIPSWEGPHTKELYDKYPLKLLTAHPPFSFHTQADGKDSTTNGIKDHRITIDGHAYWIVRLNEEEAAKRGLTQHDLVKVFNDRGAVICAVDISPLIVNGAAKSYSSSSEVNLLRTPEGVVDRGGCMNMLTNTRPISATSDGIAPNSCLIQIKKWDRVILKGAA